MFGWAAAVLIASAPLVGVMRPDAEPAFTSWPWLFALTALPALAATVLARRARPLAAAAVLVPPAILSIGALVLDARPLFGSVLVARPELYVPSGLVGLEAGGGVWPLLAGRLGVVIAGLLAVAYLTRHATDPQYEDSGIRRLTGPAFTLALVAVAGLVSTPMRSDDPYVVPFSLVDAPPWDMVGGALVVVSVLITTAVVTGWRDRSVVRAGLLGLGFAIAGAALPPVLSALFSPMIHLSRGPVLATLAAVGFVGLSSSSVNNLINAAVDRVGVRPVRNPPGQARLEIIAGLLAVTSGVSALIAAGSPLLRVPERTVPETADQLLLPSGALLILLGGLMVIPSVATSARPALSVGWVIGPLAGTAALDVVLVPPGVDASIGPGAWFAGVSVLCACGAGLAAAVAGGVERDEVDLSDLGVNRVPLWQAVIATPLVIAALVGRPAAEVPGLNRSSPVLFWGLAAALVTVVTALWLAPRCRSRRGAAVSAGAACVLAVLVVRVLVAGAEPRWPWWAGVAALLVIISGVAVTWAGAGRSTAVDESPEPSVGR